MRILQPHHHGGAESAVRSCFIAPDEAGLMPLNPSQRKKAGFAAFPELLNVTSEVFLPPSSCLVMTNVGVM